MSAPVHDSDSDADSSPGGGQQEPRADGDMEIDEGDEALSADKIAELKRDVKGKQRAIEPEFESPKRQHRRKPREPTYALRPILTIQRSQGFVWNQVSHCCYQLLFAREPC